MKHRDIATAHGILSQDECSEFKASQSYLAKASSQGKRKGKERGREAGEEGERKKQAIKQAKKTTKQSNTQIKTKNSNPNLRGNEKVINSILDIQIQRNLV